VYCKEYKFKITSQGSETSVYEKGGKEVPVEITTIRGKDSGGNRLVLDIAKEKGKLYVTLSITKNNAEKVVKGSSKTGLKTYKSTRCPGNYLVYRFYRMQGAYIEVYDGKTGSRNKRVVVKM
jgi:hypothetical protein